MPKNRRTVVVAPGETNPFGQQAETLPNLAAVEQESEEVILRKAVSVIPVGGVSGGDGEFTALLGSMRLKVGDVLPPILPRQTEKLEVVAITTKVVILGFRERDGKVADRTFAVQLNMRPVVRYMLPSQAGTAPSAPSPLQGVYVPPPNHDGR